MKRVYLEFISIIAWLVSLLLLIPCGRISLLSFLLVLVTSLAVVFLAKSHQHTLRRVAFIDLLVLAVVLVFDLVFVCT